MFLVSKEDNLQVSIEITFHIFGNLESRSDYFSFVGIDQIEIF